MSFAASRPLLCLLLSAAEVRGARLPLLRLLAWDELSKGPFKRGNARPALDIYRRIAADEREVLRTLGIERRAKDGEAKGAAIRNLAALASATRGVRGVKSPTQCLLPKRRLVKRRDLVRVLAQVLDAVLVRRGRRQGFRRLRAAERFHLFPQRDRGVRVL